MLVKIPRTWELPESAATPEAIYADRRRVIQGLGAGSILAALPLAGRAARAAEAEDPSAKLYPVPRNPAFQSVDRALTPEEKASTYNNFYEYGSEKEIWKDAQQLEVRPWEVRIDGLVEQEFTIGVDDLLARMNLEERVVRHRCVERWSMVIAWGGFPMRDFVELARPLGSAKFVRMETFLDKEMAPGQRQFWYPWPYIEGLTIAEATHELAFMVTGAYGKVLPDQHGAPLRVHLPWKYGFKSAKSIVRFTFTEERPVSFWEELQSNEYGFWANVNPQVPHPRWSQAQERDIGSGDLIPTRIYNGYEEEVASLYAGTTERIFY